MKLVTLQSLVPFNSRSQNTQTFRAEVLSLGPSQQASMDPTPTPARAPCQFVKEASCKVGQPPRALQKVRARRGRVPQLPVSFISFRFQGLGVRPEVLPSPSYHQHHRHQLQHQQHQQQRQRHQYINRQKNFRPAA